MRFFDPRTQTYSRQLYQYNTNLPEDKKFENLRSLEELFQTTFPNLTMTTVNGGIICKVSIKNVPNEVVCGLDCFFEQFESSNSQLINHLLKGSTP